MCRLGMMLFLWVARSLLTGDSMDDKLGRAPSLGYSALTVLDGGGLADVSCGAVEEDRSESGLCGWAWNVRMPGA